MSLLQLAITLTFTLCWCSSVASAQVKAPKQIQGGVIVGTVTIKGKPASGVTVIARPGQSYSAYAAVYRARTDQEGRYRIIDLPPGSYQANPAAPGFVPANLSMRRGETIVLAEGETVEGIDFALVRGGVITGKVLDANGRPLIEQRVNLVSAERSSTTQPVIIQTSNAITDDRGIYRMFGLTAGRYKVFVGQADDNFFMSVSSGRPNYRQTFHPGVIDESEATVIEVTEGSEAKDVDIVVGPSPQSFAASGRVVDSETGKPVANVRMGLQLMAAEQRNSFVGTMSTSNLKGEFRIENLLPGKYGVFITPGRDSEIRADAISIEIVDSDVEGLVIKTVKGASLAGSIVLENPGDKTALEKLYMLHLQVFVQSIGPGTGFSQTAVINPDGSFRVGGLQSGMANLSLGAMDRSLLKSFSVSRIERDDIAQQGGIAVKSGEQITGLKVFVSYGSATVRGSIKLINGTLSPGGLIFLRVNKAGDPTSRMSTHPVDARGHFIIEGLAGGTYDVMIMVTGSAVRAVRSKQQISVADGVDTEVTLTVDLESRPGSSPQQ